MRFHEIAGGFRVPISSEERNILDLVVAGAVSNSDLDERQQEVARRMVGRGLLTRHHVKDEMIFVPSADPNLWRC